MDLHIIWTCFKVDLMTNYYLHDRTATLQVVPYQEVSNSLEKASVPFFHRTSPMGILIR